VLVCDGGKVALQLIGAAATAAPVSTIASFLMIIWISAIPGFRVPFSDAHWMTR
jgi:hypothetical protein